MNPHDLAVRKKGTETLWAIETLDYNKKTITYLSFGLLVTLSFDEAELVVCE